MATWNFIVSDTYAERVGPQGVDKLIKVLAAGAHSAPGRTVAEIEEVLADAAKREDIGIAAPELESMAKNLSLHDLEAVRVTDDRDAEIAHLPVANDVSQIPVEERSDNVHLEPEDPRRPHVS